MNKSIIMSTTEALINVVESAPKQFQYSEEFSKNEFEIWYKYVENVLAIAYRYTKSDDVIQTKIKIASICTSVSDYELRVRGISVELLNLASKLSGGSAMDYGMFV